MLALPSLTEADPEVAGEGSIDPLGLGAVSERLGEMLLPGITNRMRSPRFLTAAAVGSVAGEHLLDLPSEETAATSDVAFEWMVLESFARQKLLAERSMVGVPGTSKAQAVVARKEHLGQGNYLKTPRVFGFTGIMLPLARDLRMLDQDRRPLESAFDLVHCWESDQELTGFVAAEPGTPGGTLRSSLAAYLSSSVREGRCTMGPGAALVKQLAAALRIDEFGQQEAQWLRSRLGGPKSDRRQPVAIALKKVAVDADEPTLVAGIRDNVPGEVQVVLDAVVAYEHVARRLDVAMEIWRYRSTLVSPRPVAAADVAASPAFNDVFDGFPGVLALAEERLGLLGGETYQHFIGVHGAVAGVSTPADLADAVMLRHLEVQASKGSTGRAPWFFDDATGFIVRQPYFLADEPSWEPESFGRPYRLRTFRQMLAAVR